MITNEQKRLGELENGLRDVKSELAELTLIVKKLASGSDGRRETTQAAVDGIQKSIDAIFANLRVPNTRHRLGLRYRIE